MDFLSPNMGSHLTLLQKKEIIEHNQKYPSKTHSELKMYFNKRYWIKNYWWNFIKKEKNFRLGDKVTPDTKKVIQPANQILEKALELWCNNQESINNPISEAMIRAQAEFC